MENKTSSNTKTFSVFNLNQIRMRRKGILLFSYLSKKKFNFANVFCPSQYELLKMTHDQIKRLSPMLKRAAFFL